MDSTLQNLESVLSHYGASQEVLNVIHIGPSEGNVNTFLDALNKIQKAKCYFLENNSQSMELQNVVSLYRSFIWSIFDDFIIET